MDTGCKRSPPTSKIQSKTYPHTLKDGTTVQLDFPVFVDGKAPKVTKDVFHGYQLYNSYCYRCHGTDATGGQLGPDLRRSVNSLKQQQFLSVAMEGRKEQGMPGWAGFLSEDDVVTWLVRKGRSLIWCLPADRLLNKTRRLRNESHEMVDYGGSSECSGDADGRRSAGKSGSGSQSVGYCRSGAIAGSATAR